MNDAKALNQQLLSGLETLRTQVMNLEQAVVMNAEAESALRQQLAMTQQYLDLAGVILIALNPQGDITLINAKGCAVLGWEKEALVGQNWFDTCLPHEDRARVRDAFQQLVAGVIEPVEFFENPVLTRSGEQRLIAWRNAVLTNETGHIVGILSSGEDITEHRQAREALRESTERYQSLFNRVPIGLYKTTREGQIVDANPALVDMLGYPNRESLLVTRVQDLYVNLEDRQSEQALLEQEDAIHRFQMQMRRYDGTIIWVEDHVRSILNGDGRAYYEGSLTDITERKQADLAQLESEAKFRSVAQAAPDAIITADSRGHIVFWNEAAEDMFGYTTDEVIGQSLTRIMPARYRQRHTEGMARFLATTESAMIGRQAELVGLRRDGGEFPLEFTLAAWKVGENTFFSAILRDITDRKQVEEAEREQRVLAEALRDTAAALNSTLDLNAVLDNILTNLERVLPHDTASVMIIESPGMARAVRSHGYNTFGIPDSPTDAVYRLRIDDLLGLRRMVENKRPLLIPDVESEPTWVHLEDDPASLRSYIAAPILWNGDVIGFLTLRSVIPGFFTPADTPRLQAFADQVATALHNAQLFAAERDQRILAETLAETASVLSSTLDVTTVLDRILESVGRVVPHDAANIMLLDGTTIRVAARRGYQQEKPSETFLHEHRFSLDAPHLHEMFETGLPVLIPDTARFSGWEQRPDTAWIRSHAAAPVLVQGHVVGFLNLDGREPGFFTQEHIHRLQAFANQASIAIEHAQLYEEVRRHAAELEQRVAQRTAELQKSEARYRATIEDQTDMVDRYLPGGIMTFVNRAYCEYFQRQPEELLGTSFLVQMPDGERSRVEQHIASLNREKPVATIEVREIASDGTLRWFHWIDRMIFDEQGHFVEYQGVGRDITARKRAEEKLHQMLAHETELSELKSRYVSMAAHDMRNPLAVIRSTIDLIHQYGSRLTDEKLQEKYEQIKTTIAVMVAMLDDILVLGKTESGKLTFDPAPLDVVDFCQSMAAEMGPTADTPPRIVFSSQGNHHSALMDAKLLRHILGNLLSNAIKYSPQTSPVMFSVDCGQDQITFRVQDHGIGIPEDDQKHLFEAFHRASNTGQVPGTGLGLAIVRQSVELHGGTITFESEEGVGTTFTVIIPHLSSGEAHEKNSGH
jgi:PAS domain S-box-containing protein